MDLMFWGAQVLVLFLPVMICIMQDWQEIHRQGSGTCQVGHVCVKKKRTAHADPSWTTKS